MSQSDDFEVIARTMGRDYFAAWFEPRSPDHPAVIQSRDFVTDLADAMRMHEATLALVKGQRDAVAKQLEETTIERNDLLCSQGPSTPQGRRIADLLRALVGGKAVERRDAYRDARVLLGLLP